MKANIRKKCLLGVTGGIAAYKACEIIRQLAEMNIETRVIMTKSAQEFISPLTLQALSGNEVRSLLFDCKAEQGMSHIELAKWADIFLIAPATADTIAKLANGHANCLLSTVALAYKKPLFIAPAMNQAMWLHPATQDNIQKLKQYGNEIIGPDYGWQACGETGPGRMLEPTAIIRNIHLSLQKPKNIDLTNINVTITAGPTQEPIDPVRFISNHSSGRMGYAIAEAAQALGAEVTLISGQTQLKPPYGVKFISCRTTEEMHNACIKRWQSVKNNHIFIGSAAVCDYKPNKSKNKIKKDNLKSTKWSLELHQTPDIIADAAKSSGAMVIGFAAESENLIEYAKDKLKNKNLDMIIANDISRADIGFNQLNNEVTIVTPNQEISLPKQDKSSLAFKIWAHIFNNYQTSYKQKTCNNSFVETI